MQFSNLTIVAMICLGLAGQTPDHSPSTYVPPNGYVPDAATAIKIAEAILVPIYSAEQIENEKPLRATLSNGVWTITGTLKEGLMGGVAIVKIRQKDACVVRLIHGK